MSHFIPERCDFPTELIPLAEEGVALANSCKELFSHVDKCYSSPYRRAFETAKIILFKEVQLIMFSLSGFTKWVEENADENTLLVTLDDMYTCQVKGNKKE